MTYGGGLFNNNHAWRNDAPLGEAGVRYCKWCGITYDDARRDNPCKGTAREGRIVT